ncbi:MAG TPA: peptidase C1 [Kiloniellaceae bacterium]|nr:peptidase C1 [Kiloniellaceae bacterium]
MPGSANDERRAYTGVTKDPLDLRDLMYESSLSELPFSLDHRPYVPRVLDQGREGACTGFGLAAVVNFLHYNRSEFSEARRRRYRSQKNGASARMLYEMAKRYDEWEGENYDGSSIRGAMKGWSRHGVCSWGDWPYETDDPGRLTPQRQLAALKHPLGAYYRVRHLHLNQMQSALNEVGILYASAAVHEGWYEVNKRSGRIPYRSAKVGGHAFAIVGYDERGFWVQNSWGPTWGLKGFCHLGYDDWLENGYDCWVARLGVPTAALAEEGTRLRGRVADFDYIPHESVVLENIRPHFVNLGNDGRFSSTGLYSSDEREVDEVVLEGFKETSAAWEGPKKLLVYCHGGLNSEKASAARIASLRPTFLANQIYPLHFMWETGFGDAVSGIVEDAFRKGRFKGWGSELKERFFDLVDEGVELGARGLGKPVWSQMKQNAALASTDPEGGARYTAARIKACFAELDGTAELHLVGHSAGSIFLAHLIPVLKALEMPVKTLTLYAPACSTALFEDTILRELGETVERCAVFNLTDATERDDSVGSVYHKSLLYLVSEAFEAKRGTPLLGMEAFLETGPGAKARRALGKPVFDNGKSVVRGFNLPAAFKPASESTTHGGFDNDEATLNATLRLVTGRQRLARPFA